jgi:hypothetical protein
MKRLAVALTAVTALGPTFALCQEPEVQFAPLNEAAIQQGLRIGEPFAYSVCLGQSVSLPAPGGAAHLGAAQSPCGTDMNPSPNVTGGNPPYHFVLDPLGGFPPMGITLDANGVLRGTPSGKLAASFKICAVDMSANQFCQRITLQPQPALAHAGQEQKAASKGGGAKFAVAMGGVVLAGLGLGLALKAGQTDTSTGASSATYYYANYSCGSSQQCAAAMGHAFGATGPFCARASCDAWGQQYIPSGYFCGTEAVYPVYNGPASGCAR